MISTLSIGGQSGFIDIVGISYVGTGDHYYPMLDTQVDLSCRPLKFGSATPTPYEIIEMAAELFLNSMQISHSLTSYVFTAVRDHSVSHPCHFRFPLDTKRIEKIEETRRGKDALFELRIEGMGYIKTSRELQRIHDHGPIKVKIPQSHWAGEILTRWNYGKVKLAEIYFPENFIHGILKDSYEHIEKALSHFDRGNDRETLASIYLAFEKMAKKSGFKNPDQNFFAKLLEQVEDEKRDTLRLLFDCFCKYLHLGRHEPRKAPIIIERKDSEFALTMAQLIYSYLSKIIPQNQCRKHRKKKTR